MGGTQMLIYGEPSISISAQQHQNDPTKFNSKEGINSVFLFLICSLSLSKSYKRKLLLNFMFNVFVAITYIVHQNNLQTDNLFFCFLILILYL